MQTQMIGLRDREFAHNQTAGNVGLPWPDVGFRWDRSDARHPVTVYTDTALTDAPEGADPRPVAWLLESPLVTARAYRWVSRHAPRFQRVLTFDQELLETVRHARFTPLGGCWINPADWAIHPKSRGVSLIASAKGSLPGQRLRHEVVRAHGHRLDAVLGRGYRELAEKIDGLRAFRYSIVIENCRRNFYFTEKLVDCLLTGTVPIYWGCPAISLFFDPDGLIPFTHRRELAGILDRLDEADYQRRLPALRRNLDRARRYVYPEVHVWENLRDLCDAAPEPAA
jgi:hypothetical protein